MISRNYQPVLVRSDVQSAAGRLEVTARRSDSGETLVLEVVNWGERPLKTAIRLDGFAPSKPTATVEELSGPLDAVNTAEAPRRIVPRRTEWRHAPGGDGGLTFAPYSFTVVRFQ
jgi:alpha-L-arabinofuranosidase